MLIFTLFNKIAEILIITLIIIIIMIILCVLIYSFKLSRKVIALLKSKLKVTRISKKEDNWIVRANLIIFSNIKRNYTTLVDHPKGIKGGLFYLYKSNKNNIIILKIMVLIIINTWLLLLFWKILLIDNAFVGNNNIVLTKMHMVLEPVLMYLGLDILNPNTIKMILVSFIIITSNIAVLYFHQMIIICITTIIARYGYKSYTNYLINKENMIGPFVNNIEREPFKGNIAQETPTIINIVENTEINWWLWGTVIVVGVIAVVGIGLTIWSHNTNVNNIVETNTASLNVSTSLNTKIDSLNQKTTHINNQIDLIMINHGKSLQSLENTNKLLDQKIINLENVYQDFGSKISKLEENNLDNFKLLSEETLEISREAKSFFGEVLETSSASEALILTVSKLFDGFTLLEDRITTAETRLNSITVGTTPRGANIFRNLVKKDDEI